MVAKRKSNPQSELKALIDELSNEAATSLIGHIQFLVESGSAEELADEEIEEEPAPRGRGKKGIAPKAKPAGRGRRAAAEDDLDDLDGDDGLDDDLDGDDGLDDDGLDDDLDAEPAPRGRGKKPAAKPAGRGRRAAAEDDLEDEPAPRRGRRAAVEPEDELDDLGDDLDGDDGDDFDDDLDAEPAPRRRAAAAPARAAKRRR